MPAFKITKRWNTLFIIFICLSGANAALEPESDSLKVLFIGNSLTGYNDLPGMVRKLAGNTDHSILVETHLVYGISLYEISLTDAVKTKIFSNDWDYIILQDAPHRVAYPDNFHILIPWADTHPLPPTLEKFRDMALDNYTQTQVIYFMPWAFKDGMLWIQGQTDDFFDMQEKIYANSLIFAGDLDLKIAPVGWAWNAVLTDRTDIELFNPDLSHPSLAGSYLGACVFYTSFFKDTLTDNDYISSLPEDVARYLQSIGYSIVLDDLETWYLLITSIRSPVPHQFELYQNYPNPFNPNTIIEYFLPQTMNIQFSIYNIIGQKLAVLYEGRQNRGSHYIDFRGQNLPSGIYIYELKAQGFQLRKRCLLLK